MILGSQSLWGVVKDGQVFWVTPEAKKPGWRFWKSLT